jgi:hypothetical protein
MNWKEFGSKRSWSNLRYYCDTRLESLRKTTKHLRQDLRSTGRDLIPGHPAYKAGVLITRPRRSVLPLVVIGSIRIKSNYIIYF